MDFTKAQQAAIDARNRDVLVSAAAGSGKTAVLVERVVSLLKEGKRIDRMLVVSITISVGIIALLALVISWVMRCAAKGNCRSEIFLSEKDELSSKEDMQEQQQRQHF